MSVEADVKLNAFVVDMGEESSIATDVYVLGVDELDAGVTLLCPFVVELDW